jgi:hypothetical protein
MGSEKFEEVAEDLPRLIDEMYNKPPTAFGSRLSKPATVRGAEHPADGQIGRLIPVRPEGANSKACSFLDCPTQNCQTKCRTHGRTRRGLA